LACLRLGAAIRNPASCPRCRVGSFPYPPSARTRQVLAVG
jgi:hypothetical protein